MNKSPAQHSAYNTRGGFLWRPLSLRFRRRRRMRTRAPSTPVLRLLHHSPTAQTTCLTQLLRHPTQGH